MDYFILSKQFIPGRSFTYDTMWAAYNSGIHMKQKYTWNMKQLYHHKLVNTVSQDVRHLGITNETDDDDVQSFLGI